MALQSIQTRTAIRKLSQSGIICLILAMAAMPVHAEHVGAIPADFTVSQNGAAVYRIPIDAPVATGGLRPNLAIAYNSQSGVGVGGQRVGLTGISTISRCPKTIAQDGEKRGVKYDLDDKFCLDRQRLVAISGTYGVAGSEYRTELESFRKIVANGTAGNGPSSFVVSDRDGTRHTYKAAGGFVKAGTYGLWARTLTTDTFGNRIEYQYASASGELLIDRIEYSRNASQSLSSKYAIQFTYYNRPLRDTRSGYTSGVPRVQLSRLKEIKIYRLDNNEQIVDIVRDYGFNYQIGAAGRSQLKDIRQCTFAAANDCLPKTLFTWDDGVQGWTTAVSAGQSSSGHTEKRVGDFDGDGLEDLFVVKNGEWHVLKSTGSGFSAPIDTNRPATNAQYTKPFDFNGDGKTDLLVPGSDGKWHVYQSTGTGFTDINTGEPTTGYQISYAQDVDGDGCGDLLYQSGTSIYLRKSTGTDFSTTATVVYSDSDLQYFIGQPDESADRQIDFDGDGMGDILVHHYQWECTDEGCESSSNWRGRRFDGTSYVNFGAVNSSGGEPIPVDLNDDGLTDVVYGGGTSWKHRISDGSTFLATGTSSVTSTYTSDAVFADYDGDGRMDFVGKSTSDRIVHLFNGTGFDAVGVSIGGPLDIHKMHIDEDGYDDLVGTQSYTWRVRTSQSVPAFVSKFTDGLGNTFEPNHANILVMSEHYKTPSQDPTFPVQRVKTPFYVVDDYAAGDGIGGTYTVNYEYWDALTDVQGRGNLGFRAVRASDSRDGTFIDRFYHQSWPYIGMLNYEQLGQPVTYTVIRKNDPNWTHSTLGSGSSARIFRRLANHTIQDFEVGGALNGQEIRKIVRTPTFETTHGNITVDQVTTTSAQASGDTYTTTTNYQYANYTTPWCLGLPTQIQVTRSATGALTKTRTVNQTFNSINCRLLTSTNASESSTALQLKTTLTYDGYGNVKTVTRDSVDGTAADRKTEYFYDQWGQFAESEKAYVDGKPDPVLTYSWDYSLNLPSSFENAQGQTTTWQYNEIGRLEKETRPDGTYSDFTYVTCIDCWSTGRGRFYINRADSDGLVTRDYRDRYGRSIGGYQYLPTGTRSQQTVVFDNLGRIDKQYLPYVNGETSYFVDYEYDLLGRLIEEDRPIDEAITFGSITTVSYQGLVQTATNAKNQVTVTEFDPLGRVVLVTDALNGEVEYAYTAFDQLSKTWDPANNLTTLTYNNRGDQVSSTVPGMGTSTATYTVFGELKTLTNARSQTTTFNYNQLGLADTRVDPEGTTTWNYYTSTDHKLWLPSSVSSPGGFSESYSYDTLSRASGTTTTLDSVAYTTNFEYHASGPGKGKLKRITYPVSTSGYRLKADYDYDAWGHLEKVKNGDSPTTVYYQLHETDALGRERLAALGNGLDEDRTYDRANGFLTLIKTGPNLTSTVQHLEYDWDKLGNLDWRKDHNQGKTEVFTYDALNRVKSARLNSVQTLSVNYTNIGNINYKSDVGNYVYGERGAGPTAVTTITGTRPGSYDYDADGNMTNRAGDTLTWYSYNKPNRINYGTDYAEFKYGPDRSRFKQVAKTGSSTTTTYYVGAHFEKETTGAVTKHRHNIMAQGKVVAIYTRPSSGTVTTRYVHRDHLGSVVALSDETGTVSERYSFDAFGKRRNTDWTADTGDLRYLDSHLTERGYTGHEQLDNVRLTHMNGRLQDPVIGRMISADPFVPRLFNSQAHNRYSYVFNSPLSLIDPSGYGPVCIDVLIAKICYIPGEGASVEFRGGGSPPELRSCDQGGCGGMDGSPPWWEKYFDTLDSDLEDLDYNEEKMDRYNETGVNSRETPPAPVSGTDRLDIGTQNGLVGERPDGLRGYGPRTRDVMAMPFFSQALRTALRRLNMQRRLDEYRDSFPNAIGLAIMHDGAGNYSYSLPSEGSVLGVVSVRGQAGQTSAASEGGIALVILLQNNVNQSSSSRGADTFVNSAINASRFDEHYRVVPVFLYAPKFNRGEFLVIESVSYSPNVGRFDGKQFYYDEVIVR